MGNILAIAGSGMRAAQQGVQVAAHNVANLATPDAQRLQLQRSSTADGGVATQVAVADADPAAPLADLVAARTEVLAFTANATLIRRADDMLGALLDDKA
jgi:flagellar hook-associated protein FlgK